MTTETATHTPGPWKIHNEGAAYIRVGDQRSLTIARVMLNGPDGTRSTEDDANARLIAAAPNLLAALVEIAKGEGRFSRDQLTHAENTIDDMKTLARTAIEQATP